MLCSIECILEREMRTTKDAMGAGGTFVAYKVLTLGLVSRAFPRFRAFWG